jgi:hypothetical protein
MKTATRKPGRRTSSREEFDKERAELFGEGKTFSEFEDHLYESVMESERPVDLERHKVYAENHLVYSGGVNQLIVPSMVDGFPLVQEREKGALYWIDDQLGPMVDNNVTQFVASRGEIFFTAQPGDFDQEEQARFRSGIHTTYQTKLLTEDFRQREAKRLMLEGGAYRYLFWNPFGGGRISEPEMGPVKTKVATDAYFCPECGDAGPVDSLVPLDATRGTTRPQSVGRPEEALNDPEQPAHAAQELGEELDYACPRCGHDDLVIADVPEVELQEQVGMTLRYRGDIDVDQPDSFEVTTNSWARDFAETIFLSRRRRIDVARLAAMFPNAEFAEVEDSESHGYGMRTQRSVEALYAVTDEDQFILPATSSTRHSRERDYIETWYMPVMYLNYKAHQDETFFEGTDEEFTIPKGEKWIDYFPDGMRVCKSGSGEERILGVYNQDFHDVWIYYRYKLMAGRFYGKGIEGAVPMQKWLNDLVSLIMTYAMEASAPTTVYNEIAFPDASYLGSSPSQRYAIGNLPVDVSIDQIYKVFPPGVLSPAVFEMFQAIKAEMQAHLGAFSFFAGNLPDAAQGTATGLSLVQDQANGLMSMPLALRAEADARFAELVVKMFMDNADDERYIEMTGPYSEFEAEGRHISGKHLVGEFTANVKPGSYYPRQAWQKRNDAIEFFGWRAAYMESHGKAPEPAEEEFMANLFQVPDVIRFRMHAGRRAKQNFDVMKEWIGAFEAGALPEEEMLALEMQMEEETIAAMTMGGMPPDPVSLVVGVALSKAPIYPEQDDHVAMVDWYQRYARQDKGAKESELVRQLIEATIKAHKTAVAEVAAGDQSTMAKAMQPEINRQFAVGLEQQAAMGAVAQPEGGAPPRQSSPQQESGGPSPSRRNGPTGPMAGVTSGASRNLPKLPYQRKNTTPVPAV